MQIMDSTSRPEKQSEAMRKARKTGNFKVDCECQKLDETAEWKDWAAMLGIRLKGLRTWAQNLAISKQLYNPFECLVSMFNQLRVRVLFIC